MHKEFSDWNFGMSWTGLNAQQQAAALILYLYARMVSIPKVHDLRSVADGLGCAGPAASSKKLGPSPKTAETFLEDLSKCLLANQYNPSYR